MTTEILRWASAASLALALASNGCAQTAKSAGAEAAKGAVPAGTRAELTTLEDPNTRERLAGVLATPEVQRAIDELSAGISRGVVEGLTSEEAKERLAGLVTA